MQANTTEHDAGWRTALFQACGLDPADPGLEWQGESFAVLEVPAATSGGAPQPVASMVLCPVPHHVPRAALMELLQWQLQALAADGALLACDASAQIFLMVRRLSGDRLKPRQILEQLSRIAIQAAPYREAIRAWEAAAPRKGMAPSAVDAQAVLGTALSPHNLRNLLNR